MSRIFFTLAVLALWTISLANTTAATLRAGAYAQDISPALPISLNGGLADRIAKVIHDPLHARCLVLDDGTTKIAIAICDSCMIPREVFDAAKEIASKKTGIPVSNMLFSATHTHTAPTASGVFQSDPDENYRKLLVEKIAAGIIAAHANLEPAKAAWSVGSDEAQVFNRRWLAKEGIKLPNPFGEAVDKVKMNPGLENPNVGKPAGPIDPLVTLLSVYAGDGRPIALFANYSLHYVGGTPGDQVSADYFGMFAKRAQELLGVKNIDGNPPFVAAMSNGTSGDINNVNFALRAFPPRKPGEQAALVADSVAQAVLKAPTITPLPNIIIKAAEAEIELGVRKPSADDVTKAKEILEKAKAGGPVLKTLPEIYARETVLLSEYPDTVKLKLQAFRIGNLGIVAIPCETFVEIGLAIKRMSPLRPTCIVSLANGYNGYLPTPAHHALGGYETWRARSSYLEASASEKVEKKALELLNEVAK